MEPIIAGKNSEGKNVACCTYNPVDKLASLGLVFTYPEYRRRHYAENLVYHVTKIVEQRASSPCSTLMPIMPHQTPATRKSVTSCVASSVQSDKKQSHLLTIKPQV